MATKINLDKLLNVTELGVGSYEFDSKKYQGLRATNKTHLEMEDDYAYQILQANDGNYKAGDLKITVAADTYVYVRDYLKSNGKSKCNLLVGTDYDPVDHPTDYGEMVNDSVVDNPNQYTAATLIDARGKFSQSITTTAYNDTVNLTGFQAEDPTAAAYIKKGFTVKTAQGDDVITGSELSDSITGGAGANTVNVDLANSFGNDVINFTKGEILNLNFAHQSLAGQLEYAVADNGKDVEVVALGLESRGEVTKTTQTDGIEIDPENLTYRYEHSEIVGETLQTTVYKWNGAAWAEDEAATPHTHLTEGYFGYIYHKTGEPQHLVDTGLAVALGGVPADATAFEAVDVYQRTATTTTFAWDPVDQTAEAVVPAVEATLYTNNNDPVGPVYMRGETNINAEVAGYDNEAAFLATATAFVIVDEDEILGSVTLKNAMASGALAANLDSNLMDPVNLLTAAFNTNYTTKGNKITGTAYGDVVVLDAAHNVVNAGAGNDVITGSTANDDITGGAGNNTLLIVNEDDLENPVAFGNDVVNLTKGENLTVDFAENVAAGNISVVGKDIVVQDGVNGKVTFKNLAAQDVVGEHGSVRVDALGDIRALVQNDVELLGEGNLTKYTSNYLGSDVDIAAGATEAQLKSNLTVDLSKSKFDNIVDLEDSTGKNTIKGGSADDVVTGGEGADTITLGTGENVFNNAGVGNDVVNLTRDEELTVNLDDAAIDWRVVKNDVVVVTGVDANANITDSVTFKNFASKDVVGADGAVTVGGDPLQNLEFTTTWSDEAAYYNTHNHVLGETVLTSRTKSFTGSRLKDTVDATGFTVYDKNGDPLEVVAEPAPLPVDPTPEQKAAYKDALKEYNTYLKTKGVTVDAKDGANEFEGSIYADTYKGGAGVDAITASAGNDTYTLGKGANTVDYDVAAANTHTDTFKLTKEEVLTVNGLEAGATFAKVGNDIVIDNDGTGTIVLKNLATGKTGADVNIGVQDIWDQDINIEATSKTVTGTLGNDIFTSTQKSATTFVETYDHVVGIKENEIHSTNIQRTAADTIKISTSDKLADKVSAYDMDYTFNSAGVIYNDNGYVNGTVTVATGLGNNVAYQGQLLNGLNLVDATGAQWSLYNDVVADNIYLNYIDDGFPLGWNSANLSASKTNNIAMIENDEALIIDSKKNDIIIANDAEDLTFNYTAGKDLYTSDVAGSDDTYLATLDKKTTLIVSDEAGDNALRLKAKDNKFNIFFNVAVDEEGHVDAVGTDLTILDKATYAKPNAKTAATLLGDNAFAAGTIVLKDAIDNGNLANLDLNGFTITTQAEAPVAYNLDAALDAVKASVVAWLAASEYDSTADVLAGGDKADIASLMQAYTAVDVTTGA